MNAKRNKIITAILSAVLATLSGLTMTGQIQKVFSFNGNHSEIAFAIVTLFMAFVLITFTFSEETKSFDSNLKDN